MKRRITNVILSIWLILNITFLFAGWGERGYWLSGKVYRTDLIDLDNMGYTSGYIDQTPVGDFFLIDTFEIWSYDITELLTFGLIPAILILGVRYIRNK